MSEIHKPVLLQEVLASFLSQPLEPTKILDGTLGRGGHAVALLKKFPELKIVAFDKDPQAVHFAQRELRDLYGSRLEIIHDDFKNYESHRLGMFDGALFDLGVSSPQFDNAERGFSFTQEGPLDMRMNPAEGVTAAEIVNTYSEKELSDLFYYLGEVRKPNRVVRAIVHDRGERPFQSTRQLASLIERVDGRRRGRTHPATNYFMALRLAVNGELEKLRELLMSLSQSIHAGGRICVISFHSLEDRIVKKTFLEMNKKTGNIVNKKVIIPSKEEVDLNPRSRSSKLRVFQIGEKDE